MDERRPHVVIVGAGFGGLAAARALAGAPVRVTLIDRENYSLFSPLLYQVASCLLNPSEIAMPLRRALRGIGNVSVRRATVASIDFDAHVVHLDGGARLDYDQVVVATGSETNHFGNAGAEHHALELKTLGHAIEVRNHILECLERAAVATGPERRRLLTFCVVGAGPTGVELAGALSELVRLVLPDEFPELRPDEVRIVLVEAGDRVLAPFAPSLSRYAHHELLRKGIDVRTSTAVADVTPRTLTTVAGTTIDTATVVWTAGVRATGPADHVVTAPNGRWQVDDHLRIVGTRDAYAIGDLAAATTRGRPVVMQSPGAMQGGRYVARLLRDRLRGASTPPFRYRSKGSMATIGRHAAIAQIGPVRLRGFVGWVAWLAVHIYYLLGIHNRLQVLARWSWHYLHWDRPIRIIVGPARHGRVAKPAASG